MAIIYLPAALSKKTNATSLRVSATKLSTCLEEVMTIYPDLRPYLFVDKKPAPFIKIFINHADSDKLDGLDTSISMDDEIQIVLAIAGG